MVQLGRVGCFIGSVAGRQVVVVQKIQNRPGPGLLSGKIGAEEASCVSGMRFAERESPAGNQHRIVVTVSLSQKLPHHFLGETLAQSIRDETGESVLLVQLTPGGNKTKTDAFTVGSLLTSPISLLPRNNGTISKISLQVNEGAESVNALLGHLCNQYDCILVQGSLHGTPHSTLLDFASRADSIYLLLPFKAEELRHYHSFAADLRTRIHGENLDIHAVLCASEKESAPELLAFCDKHPHTFIHDCPPADFAPAEAAMASIWFLKDMRRLAREIGHCRLGLALSAGGAKGLAHIGVIQVLEENGIEVDVIAGCSMGAYIAAAWAAGCDGEKLEKLARENEKLWGFWGLLDPTFMPRQGFLHGKAVRRRLEQTVGDSFFSDLARPMRCVATNLDTLDREIFASGQVAEAVQASCAIPGVILPVCIRGETYIDGGVSDPLPVDVLAEMRVDRIIAVNAIQPSAFLRCCREKEREQAELCRKRFSFFKNLNQQLNYFARGNILDIMMRAVHGGQIRMAEHACGRADVVLRPLAIDAYWHDFNHPGKYIALGRKIALEHLDELQALVKPKAPHEHPSTHHEMAALI